MGLNLSIALLALELLGEHSLHFSNTLFASLNLGENLEISCVQHVLNVDFSGNSQLVANCLDELNTLRAGHSNNAIDKFAIANDAICILVEVLE